MFEAHGLSKRFGPVVANDSVDLFLARHSVHAVLGQNGAGKTTLANMLSGLYRPDGGTLRLDGEIVEFRNPPDALARGVGMVHQHARLVDRLTVEENIVLGDPGLPYYLDHSKIRARVRSLMDRYGLSVRVGAYAGELSAGERQRVDLLKTLFRGVDVLLLDEPTAVLVPAEVERLFETIRSFAADGVAVMIITHKLREVMAVSDTVTVMRDGRVELVIPTEETTAAALATAMMGRPVEHEFSRQEGSSEVGEPVLAARDLEVSRTNDREGLYGIARNRSWRPEILRCPGRTTGKGVRDHARSAFGGDRRHRGGGRQWSGIAGRCTGRSRRARLGLGGSCRSGRHRWRSAGCP